MGQIRARCFNFALILGLVTLLSTVAACAPETPAPTGGDAATATATTAAEPARGTVAAADGVPIVYETRGAGDVAIVFVHCWACNRTFWREQVEPVAAAGYRVVALDLPGHGESGAGRAQWSLAGLGADVEAVADELELERMVLVGHSMGGPVSLEAAGRMPGRVLGIACVDTLHNADFEFPQEVGEQMATRLATDYRAGMESFVPQLFRDDADPEVVAWVIEQAVASDQAATIALMRAFADWDAPAAMSAAGAPIRCINAAAEGEQGLTTEIEINRKYADFDAVLMEGVGHYPQLERPGEFNERLLAALQELTAGSGERAARSPGRPRSQTP